MQQSIVVATRAVLSFDSQSADDNSAPRVKIPLIMLCFIHAKIDGRQQHVLRMSQSVSSKTE